MFRLLLVLALSATTFISLAQNSSEINLFDEDEVIELNITTDVKHLKREKGDDRQYQNGKVSHVFDGKEEAIDVKIKTRGNFRRKMANCNMPPLYFNFGQKYDEGLFGGIKKVKLVTQCKTENNLINEYLVYKLYNVVSEYSFQARLVKLNFTDENKPDKIVSQYGFFIEDKKHFEQRIDEGSFVSVERISYGIMNPWHMDVMSLFQFMVANTDWSVPYQHNMKTYYPEEFGMAYPVPYDFDWSALVHANYAVPNAQLPIDNVEERLYMGPCRSIEELQPAIDLFISKKEVLLDVYRKSPYLEERDKKWALRYLGEFFKIIEEPEELKRYFFRKC